MPSPRSLALALGALASAPALALARVGGGESWGGGGGGGGGFGGGGDGGGEVAELLLWLIIRHPKIGIPVTIVVVVVVLWQKSQQGSSPSFEAFGSDSFVEPAGATRDSADLAGLRARDPAFSRFAFLEFAHLLYVRYSEARGTSADGLVRAYLGPDLLARIRAEGVETARVIVGALELQTAAQWDGRDVLRVRVESNVDETVGGTTTRWFQKQILRFERASGLKSPPPDRLMALRCPSCGDASELDLEGRCSSCRNVVDDGRFGWRLVAVDTVLHVPQRPIDLKLGGGGIEPGYHNPTRYQDDLAAAKRAMATRNPGLDWTAFEGRIRHVFVELQAAWSEGKWERARPYETDRLFQSHRFWIERYRAQGLRNALDDVTVERVLICEVRRDPWFEIVTARIFASMKDYVVDRDGNVVAGSDRQVRRFSEYWTFIKRSGVPERAGHPASCPSCAAPLDKVTQAGVCEYCGTKIVTGDHDWTLALIEQD